MPNVERTAASFEQHLTANSLVLLQELSTSFSDLMQNLEHMIGADPTRHTEDSDCDACYEEIYTIEDIRDCMAVIRASPLFEQIRVFGKTHDDFLVYWWRLELLVKKWDSDCEDRDRHMERSEMMETVESMGDSEMGGRQDVQLDVGSGREEVPRASSRSRTDPNPL